MTVELTDGRIFENVNRITVDEDGYATIHFDDNTYTFGKIKEVSR